jgi:hypothetical protein
LRAARAAKSAEEFEVHFQRAIAFKSLAKNLGQLMRNASDDERKRAGLTTHYKYTSVDSSNKSPADLHRTGPLRSVASGETSFGLAASAFDEGEFDR